MILYATASLSGNDLESLRRVIPYASMGFLQGGVELASVREIEPEGYPHILISFLYDRDRDFFEEKLRYRPPDSLGDSGAFTAWTVGETVDLGELIEWCRWQLDQQPDFQTISLDVIPGDPGGDARPSKKERDRAMRGSLENGDAMRAAGLRIMEVFHVFEPLSHLDLLLDRRQPGEAIGLGGMVGRSVSIKRQFIDAAVARIRDYSGGWESLIPIHGLGLSVVSPLASRYPWHSLDSSSWIAPAQYGKPVARNGRIGMHRSQTDRRTANQSVRQLYLGRVLQGWLEREAALTRLWAERGVRFRD